MSFHIKKRKTFFNLIVLYYLQRFTTNKIHFDQNIRKNLVKTINTQIFHCQETLHKFILISLYT